MLPLRSKNISEITIDVDINQNFGRIIILVPIMCQNVQSTLEISFANDQVNNCICLPPTIKDIFNFQTRWGNFVRKISKYFHKFFVGFHFFSHLTFFDWFHVDIQSIFNVSFPNVSVFDILKIC